jgi:hypothetical protein
MVILQNFLQVNKPQDVGLLDACARMKEVYPSLLAVLHP